MKISSEQSYINKHLIVSQDIYRKNQREYPLLRNYLEAKNTLKNDIGEKIFINWIANYLLGQSATKKKRRASP